MPLTQAQRAALTQMMATAPDLDRWRLRAHRIEEPQRGSELAVDGDEMRKIKLADPQPSYIESPVDDPKKAMERARKRIRAERTRRARFLITSPARRRASTQDTTHLSGLQRRIAEGLADPISDLEREQLKQMEQIYIRRFGKKPGDRHERA